MKKYLLPAFAAAMIIVPATSCSDYETSSPESPDGDSGAIRFAAAAEYARSGDLTTNNLKSFNVYAFTGSASSPTMFMENVVVSKTDKNTWTYSPVQYWPANETVDFYAFAPAGWVGQQGPLSPVAVDNYPGDKDLIYAVCSDMSGHNGEPNAQVTFNFRHALSKVSVKLSSTNAKLKVKVSNVVLANIRTRGNFSFPSATTAGAATDENVGKWTDQNSPMTYVYHMSQTPDDLLTLTPTPDDMSASGMGGARYLLPQVLSWRSNGGGTDTYLAVMCSIYDASSGTKLWPNANTPAENIVEGSTFGDGLLKFPLSTGRFSAWAPGNHYVYNLVINSNEEMGAIEFGDPTVDTYVEVNSNFD